MSQATLTIGQLARRAGLNTSAIRFYERRGVLPQPGRVNGQRRYTEDTLKRLTVIDVCKRAGFSLDEVGVLLRSTDGGAPAHEQLRELAARKLPDVDALIERTGAVRAWLATATGCGCASLDVCGLFDTSAAVRMRRLPDDRLGAYSLRSADASDAARVAELVETAYGHYVERLGMLPRPMTDDYAAVIRDAHVTVVELQGAIVGVIVLAMTDDGLGIDNVAVHPSHRGTGLGRALLAFAEAEALRAGLESIVLYTHEKMTENLAIYSTSGYVEFDRRSQGEFSLVYMKKQLCRSER